MSIVLRQFRVVLKQNIGIYFFMKNARIFAQTHIHTNISGMGHMNTCSVNIVYTQLMYVFINQMKMLTL